MTTFTAYIEFDPETKLYVGIVPGIPGAHTQGETLRDCPKRPISDRYYRAWIA